MERSELAENEKQRARALQLFFRISFFVFAICLYPLDLLPAQSRLLSVVSFLIFLFFSFSLHSLAKFSAEIVKFALCSEGVPLLVLGKGSGHIPPHSSSRSNFAIKNQPTSNFFDPNKPISMFSFVLGGF